MINTLNTVLFIITVIIIIVITNKIEDRNKKDSV